MKTYLSTCGVPTGSVLSMLPTLPSDALSVAAASMSNGRVATTRLIDSTALVITEGAAFAAADNGFCALAGLTGAAVAPAAVRPTVDATADFADRAASKQDKQRWTRTHVLGSPPWSHPVF